MPDFGLALMLGLASQTIALAPLLPGALFGGALGKACFHFHGADLLQLGICLVAGGG